MTFFKIFFSISLTIWVFVGCQTKPLKTVELTDKVDISKLPKYVWETKAQIRDLKRNKNNNVSIDFLAVKNQRLRLEIQATLGIPVGTLGMNQDNFIAILYTQKKVIQGKMEEKTLMKSFNLPIPPESLYAIAFDDVIKHSQWKCYYDSNKVVSLCENANLQSKIEWKNRSAGTKLVKITNPNMEVDWYFKAPQVLDVKADTFNINVPNGYKVINLE